MTDGAPDILSPEFAANPYPLYTVMREEYPLIYHEPMQSYILSRYEDVERAFKDPIFSSKNYDWQLEPVHGRTILQMDGREHSAHRGIVTPAFRGRDLQEKFVPVIENNARELIAAFQHAGEVEFCAAFARRFPVNVIVDMLGLAKADYLLFHQWYGSIIAFLSNLTQDPAVTAAGLKTKDEFQNYILPIIAQRRNEPGADLLSTLCNASIDGVSMNDEEIKAFCSLLLTAGGETTDKALASLLRNLLDNPDQFAAVRADRTLIDKAFAETLRYSSPVQMIMRTPTEDVTVSGGTIPANSTVTCLIGAANRDPNQYADPDTFNLFRPDLDTGRAFTAGANHAAFALGRHFCVGAMLARAEITISVNQIFDALPELRYADGFTPHDEGVFTRGPKSLHLAFTPA